MWSSSTRVLCGVRVLEFAWSSSTRVSYPRPRQRLSSTILEYRVEFESQYTLYSTKSIRLLEAIMQASAMLP